MKSKYRLEASIKEDNRLVRAPISDINSTVKRATVRREGSNDIITLSKKKMMVPLAPGKDSIQLIKERGQMLVTAAVVYPKGATIDIKTLCLISLEKILHAPSLRR